MDLEVMFMIGTAILGAFGVIVVYLIKKNVDIYFDKKRAIEIQALVDAGKVNFPANFKGESIVSLTKGILSETREDHLQAVKRVIIPKWLIHSLIFLYGFHLINSTVGTFFNTSLTGIIMRESEFDKVINWLIYELTTGLTLWLFFCLYWGLNLSSIYPEKKQSGSITIEDQGKET